MSLITRVQNIALRPKDEWPVIAGETTSVASLYTGVIAPLALIGPVCLFLSALIFGQRIPVLNVTVHPAAGVLLGSLIVSYVLTLVGVGITAVIVEKLAPNFQSSGDLAQALKLVAYSQAPFWVAGVLNLIPFVGVLTLLVGLYGLYLVYLGMPTVMKTPPDKVLPYVLVVIGISIVVWIVIAVVTSTIVGTGAMMGSGA
ncbi:MAG: YIP1 family protein [candidate division Zixibacteria bacterium]|nr:YIP1 family protein [candidate division Zixibacteria bacterium]